MVIEIEEVDELDAGKTMGRTTLSTDRDGSGKYHIVIQIYTAALAEHNSQHAKGKKPHSHSIGEIVAHEMGHASYAMKMASSHPAGMEAGWSLALRDSHKGFGESAFAAMYAGILFRIEKIGYGGEGLDVTEFTDNDRFSNHILFQPITSSAEVIKKWKRERNDFLKRKRPELPFRDPYPIDGGPFPYEP